MSVQSPPDIHHDVPAGIGQVRRLLDVVRAEMHDHGVASALSDTTQIILAEVLNNVVEHAYGFVPGHPMVLSLRFGLDGIACEIRDEGKPMPWGGLPAGIMPMVDREKPEELPEGGFGWALVRDLTCDLRYSREQGCNRLTFVVPRIGRA